MEAGEHEWQMMALDTLLATLKDRGRQDSPRKAAGERSA
jgi:hypothetical protein